MDRNLVYLQAPILARTFKSSDRDLARTAGVGLAQYWRHWEDLFRSALILTVLGFGVAVAVAILAMLPLGCVALLSADMSEMGKLVLFLVGVYVGVWAKWLVFDPIARTVLVLDFFEESEGLTPGPDWEGRLEEASETFRQWRHEVSEGQGQ